MNLFKNRFTQIFDVLVCIKILCKLVKLVLFYLIVAVLNITLNLYFWTLCVLFLLFKTMTKLYEAET